MDLLNIWLEISATQLPQVYCSTFFGWRRKHAFGTRNMVWHSEFTEFFWEQRSILVCPSCMHHAFCIFFWRHTPLTFVLRFKSRINQDFYFKKVTGNKKWLILPCKPWLDNFCSSSSQIKRSGAAKLGRVRQEKEMWCVRRRILKLVTWVAVLIVRSSCPLWDWKDKRRGSAEQWVQEISAGRTQIRTTFTLEELQRFQ